MYQQVLCAVLAVSDRRWTTHLTSFATRKVESSDDVVAHDTMRLSSEKYTGQIFNFLNQALIAAIVYVSCGPSLPAVEHSLRSKRETTHFVVHECHGDVAMLCCW